jgi:hypothetical protein
MTAGGSDRDHAVPCIAWRSGGVKGVACGKGCRSRRGGKGGGSVVGRAVHL